jgi:ArsR family transcriptional regulator
MELKETTKLYGALSDETRLRVLFILSQGEFCVQDLMKILEVPQSTISRHLGVLDSVALVKSRRERTRVFYTLREPAGVIHQRVFQCVQQVFPAFSVIKKDRKKLQSFRK